MDPLSRARMLLVQHVHRHPIHAPCESEPCALRERSLAFLKGQPINTERSAEVMGRLLADMAIQDRLATKSGAELADLLIEHVWADAEMLSPKAALIEACADRLRDGHTRCGPVVFRPYP